MSDFLLDTDVLARCLRGIPETLALARHLTEEGDLHISVWAHLEILSLAQPQEEKSTREFLAPFILHPINEGLAQRAAELHRMNQAPSFADAILMATALEYGLTLVTYGALPRVSELKLYPIA